MEVITELYCVCCPVAALVKGAVSLHHSWLSEDPARQTQNEDLTITACDHACNQ